MKYKLIAISVLILLLVVWLYGRTALTQTYYEFRMKTEYNSWLDSWSNPKYDEWNCTNKSRECEKYFETVLNTECYLVYGGRYSGGSIVALHMWNMVVINNEICEFESTTLNFQEVSLTYNIHHIQEGFYVEGIEYEKSQSLDNWENLT